MERKNVSNINDTSAHEKKSIPFSKRKFNKDKT